METIQKLIETGRIEEAIAQLDRLIELNPDDDALLFARGKAHWRAGERSSARKDYLAALSLNPDSPAGIALKQAEEIENFFNPDLLNP